MKKILAILLVLVLVPISGFGSAKSEIEEIFYEIPVSAFSRYPADNFTVPLMLINKGDKEIKVQNITFALSDGTKILEKDLEETLNPSLLKGLGNNEIRDKIGIVLPEEKSVVKAKEFLDKAKTMEKGEERTGNIEAAWLLLMNKDHYTETEETEKILSHSKIFYFTIHLKDLDKDIEPVDFIPINIDMVISNSDGSTYTISQTTTLFYLNSLPSQWSWYPGDGHMHTAWSDAYFQSITSRRNDAYNKNLKWIIITDHAGDSQHTSQPRLEWNEWSSYNTDCNTAQNIYPYITVCPGEELATIEGTGGSHLLSYKNNSYVSSYGNKQTLINNVYAAGGFGIIAHPYNSSFPWTDWYTYPQPATSQSFRGIELISHGYVVNDSQLADWDYYLRSHIANTMKDPNHRFCVGLSNSDAHLPLTLGTNMTYIYTGSSFPPGTDRPGVYNALERGRATASSDGSLLVHKITTGGTYLPGYYMQKSSAGYITVNVYAQCIANISTGYADIKIVTSDGTVVTDRVNNQTIVNKDYSIYVSHDTYVRVQVTFYNSQSGAFSYCFSNPTFIDFLPYNQ